MKLYNDFKIDDSWTLTIEKKPDVNKEIDGIYYDWVYKKGNYIQTFDIYNLVYMNLPEKSFYETYSTKSMFFKKEIKDRHKHINYVAMNPPYAWRYKEY